MRQILLIASFWTFVLMGHSPADDSGSPGTWQKKTGAPSDRTEVVAAALDGKLYVSGGFGRLGSTGRVEQYDTETDRWKKMAALPVSVHHAAAGVVNGKIYV